MEAFESKLQIELKKGREKSAMMSEKERAEEKRRAMEKLASIMKNNKNIKIIPAQY